MDGLSEYNQEGEGKILSKKMLPCKLVILVYDIFFAAAFNFLILFYKTIGFTMTKVGLGVGFVDLLAFFTYILFGVVLDSIKRYRTLLFTGLCLGTAILTSCTPWIVSLITKVGSDIKCSDNSTFHNISLLQVGGNCTATPTIKNPESLFFIMITYGTINAIVIACLSCYIEGSIVKVVFSNTKGQSYGKQKVFSPIGQAMGSFIAGVAVDLYKPPHLPQYSAAFFVSGPFCLLLIPLLSSITKQIERSTQSDSEEEEEIPVYRHVLKVVKKTDTLVFMTCVFVCGLGYEVYLNFIFVFVHDAFNPSKTMMSLVSVISTVSDLAIYPFTSKLINVIGGPLRTIYLCLFIYALRLILVSFSTNVWHVIAIQLLDGFSTSLSWTAMIEHVYGIFPKKVTNTAIGILAAVHYTFARLVGTPLGGYLYFKYNGSVLFLGLALACLVVGILMMLYVEIRRRKETAVAIHCCGEIATVTDVDMEKNE